MDSDLKNFLESCLQVNPKNRSIPEELLKHKIFEGVTEMQFINE